jgi:transcriptional regulator with GAF, ATPase, and Fis domain
VGPSPLDLAIARAVLEISRERSLPGAMHRVLTMVIEAVPAVDAAAVMVWDRTVPTPSVATDALVQEVIDRHLATGQTPAVTACDTREPVYSGDLSREDRWPDFARDMAATLGICSLFAVPLAVHDVPLGALVIYAKSIDAFDAEDLETTEIAAIHACAALADSLERRQLSRGLTTRTVIGQATGIVMQQFDLDAEAAFAVLRRLSQNHNEKVHDLAVRIVATRVVG